MCMFVVFRQKSAYEIRIRDWSSDVCSSDLATLGDIDQNVAKFSLSDRQSPIRVALDEDARERLSTIENLPVATQSGGSVPLSVVAEVGFESGRASCRERVSQYVSI